ncbi:MAG: hypothetical protein ACR2QL_04925 [Woeseiaceae bacterium]
MNHDIGKLVFGLVVGVLVAVFSYRWIMNVEPRDDRLQEESVVVASRVLLETTLVIGSLQIVDPLAPDRVVGKAYVYPRENEWEVSGFYRRNDDDLWHPYLMTLNAELGLVHLKVSDTALLHRDGEVLLEVLP